MSKLGRTPLMAALLLQLAGIAFFALSSVHGMCLSSNRSHKLSLVLDVRCCNRSLDWEHCSWVWTDTSNTMMEGQFFYWLLADGIDHFVQSCLNQFVNGMQAQRLTSSTSVRRPWQHARHAAAVPKWTVMCLTPGAGSHSTLAELGPPASSGRFPETVAVRPSATKPSLRPTWRNSPSAPMALTTTTSATWSVPEINLIPLLLPTYSICYHTDYWWRGRMHTTCAWRSRLLQEEEEGTARP